MRNQLIIIGLALLVLIPAVSADLIVSPTTFTITQKVGEAQNYTMNLTNTFNFVISNFTFLNLSGFSFPQISLQPNESRVITFNVSKSESGVFNTQSKISFKFVEQIPEGETTHYINITDMGYSPNYLSVRSEDTVTWTNVDSLTHTVTSSKFDYSLAPNATQSYVFHTVGTLEYQDLIMFYGGTINIVNATSPELINNPTYDVPLTMNIEITLNPTGLDVVNTQNNYTVDASGSVEGLMQITNNGNETAERISLTADPTWIRFDSNTFNLNKGEKKYVVYHVEPTIFATADTNKTHAVTVHIKASNSPEYLQPIDVFIPYKGTFDDVNTNEGFVAFFKRFCQQNPQLIICNNTIQESQNGTVVIRDVQIPINLTSREVYAMLQRIQRIEDSNSRTNNEVKKVSDSMGDELPAIKQLLNESLSMAKDNDDVSTSRTRAFWIGFLFFIFVVCILVVGFFVRKYYYKKNLMGGGYRLQ